MDIKDIIKKNKTRCHILYSCQFFFNSEHDFVRKEVKELVSRDIFNSINFSKVKLNEKYNKLHYLASFNLRMKYKIDNHNDYDSFDSSSGKKKITKKQKKNKLVE